MTGCIFSSLFCHFFFCAADMLNIQRFLLFPAAPPSCQTANCLLYPHHSYDLSHFPRSSSNMVEPNRLSWLTCCDLTEWVWPEETLRVQMWDLWFHVSFINRSGCYSSESAPRPQSNLWPCSHPALNDVMYERSMITSVKVSGWPLTSAAVKLTKMSTLDSLYSIPRVHVFIYLLALSCFLLYLCNHYPKLIIHRWSPALDCWRHILAWANRAHLFEWGMLTVLILLKVSETLNWLSL